jgi:hypothetical protein
MSAEVSLVFPPLVQSNFGAYFPATATLAAYLSQNQISCQQEDLNERFALFLLQDEVIESFVQGCVGRDLQPLPEEMPAVAARLLRQQKHLLFDEQGRHRFRDDKPGPGHLLSYIAKPCLIDMPLQTCLNQEQSEWPNSDIYERFFEASGYVNDLPQSVRLVGISVPMGPQLLPALMLAGHVKRTRPQVRVVLGGPTMSLMSDSMRGLLLSRCPEVDLIVRYEGERPLTALVQQIQADAWSPQTVPGVSCMQGEQMVDCPAEPGPALDELPFAEYDPRIVNRLADPELGIIQARGCYWGGCAYCDFVELYAGSKRYRTRAPRRFVDGLELQVERYGVRSFTFITESIPPGFARRVSTEIINRKLEISWNSFAMVDRQFDRELLDLMRRSGCEYLVIGLESMDDRVLELVNKRARREDNIRFLKDGRDAGIRLHVNLIADLPSTSYADAMASLAEMENLVECCASVFAFPFEATRSSAVGRNPGKYLLQAREPEAVSGQGEFATNHLPVIDQAMSPEERAEVHAAYSRFGQQFNEWWGQDTSAFAMPNQLVDDPEVHLAHEYVDTLVVEDGVQCYHWGMRQLFKMPPGWDRIIELAREMGWFRPSTFVDRFSPRSVGESLLGQMAEHALLLRRNGAVEQ